MFKYGKYYFLIFIANISLLFSLNYLVGKGQNNNIYSLSKNYQEFIKGKDIRGDLSFLLENNHIRVIGEVNHEIIGLYDPMMEYYIKSSKVISPTRFRYFSLNDYIDKKDVGIIFNDINEIISHNDDKKVREAEDKFNTKIVNEFDFSSNIYKDGLVIIKNIFSIDPQNIKRVFIDYDIGDIAPIIKKMEEVGFVKKEKSSVDLLWKALRNIHRESLYTKTIFINSIVVYFFLILICFLFIRSQKNEMVISRLFGSTEYEYIKIFIVVNIFKIILCLLISSILVMWYFKFINKLNFDFVMALIVNFINFIIIITSCILVQLGIFKKLKNKRK